MKTICSYNEGAGGSSCRRDATRCILYSPGGDRDWLPFKDSDGRLMQSAPIPEDDVERLKSLSQMILLSTPREADLDRITRIAQKVFGTEIALISLVDEKRQWFKSRIGLDVLETPRDISFCGHAIGGNETFVVTDASLDERFSDNPLVVDGLKVRFYAGQPIANRDGFNIGTLCVISATPKILTAEQSSTLEDLGRLVEIVLENRQMSSTQLDLLRQLDISIRDSLIDSLSGLWNRKGFDAIADKEIEHCRLEGAPISFFLLDVDNFKSINDVHGHPVGDLVIKKLSDVLVGNTRSTDSVFRIGGEEFLVVCPHADQDAARRIGSNLITAIEREGSVLSDATLVPFRASIGIATARPSGSDTGKLCSALCKHADTALYQAKSNGKNCYVLFDEIAY